MRERDIQTAILAAIGSRPDVRLWRANTGVAIPLAHACPLCRGRGVRFGVVGQADLSGIVRGGRRLEVEVKSPTGRPSEQQVRFGNMIRSKGGIYVVARSVEDVERAIY